MPNFFRLYLLLLALMVVVRLLGLQDFFGLLPPGILPGYPMGWTGILTAPFFHAGYAHLFSNLIPLLVLGGITWSLSPRHFPWNLGVIWITGGLGVYFWGRPVMHIGASGWVYGLLGYLFFLGIFSRNPRAFLVSLAVALLYGGAAAGVLPVDAEVSWESHLYSALTGIALAWIFRKDGMPPPPPAIPDEEEISESEMEDSPVISLEDWDEYSRREENQR